jgi:tetratricopeptide (TPR) repeat protein
VELVTLYNQLDKPQRALESMLGRKFQPWEGGEGLVLAQYERSQLLLGRRALEDGDAACALKRFEDALQVPETLGEAKHFLANRSELRYWLGEAHRALGQSEAARSAWQLAARERGDFQQMSVLDVSDMTYWSGMATERLGNEQEAAAIFKRIYDFSIRLAASEPKIDYFATSLPAMLLFEDDLKRRNETYSLFLRAQAAAGLGRKDESLALVGKVLERDRNHNGAADLLRQLESPVSRPGAR